MKPKDSTKKLATDGSRTPTEWSKWKARGLIPKHAETGYTKVKTGFLKEGDQIWDIEERKFYDADLIEDVGRPVTDFHYVQRKLTKEQYARRKRTVLTQNILRRELKNLQ